MDRRLIERPRRRRPRRQVSLTYYDTGILVKLYTAEPESPAVERFVRARGSAISVLDLHVTECMAAFRLKEFRGQCTSNEASAAIGALEDDLAARVLALTQLSWADVWSRCQTLVRSHCGSVGARTLDALHVAAALVLHASELVTSNERQAALARACGLAVADPTRRRTGLGLVGGERGGER